jgi:hypothetical protein
MTAKRRKWRNRDEEGERKKAKKRRRNWRIEAGDVKSWRRRRAWHRAHARLVAHRA